MWKEPLMFSVGRSGTGLYRRPGRTRALATAGLAVTVLLAGCANDSGDPAAGASPATTASSAAPSGAGHQHKMHPAPTGKPPSVRLEVTADPDSGWNVHLITANFRFAPERAGGEVRTGEGHAHLYVDGAKVARVYGPWHHLPADPVPAGKHTLKAELNANDHGPWVVDGKPVAATTTLTGTASGGAQGTRHGAVDVTVKVALNGGKASPAGRRVEVRKGQKVRLEVTADQGDTVHVHGYDLERPASPGSPATIEFTADKTGLFEVETHDAGVLLVQLAVR
jgi:hypothetical protein